MIRLLIKAMFKLLRVDFARTQKFQRAHKNSKESEQDENEN